MFKLSSERGTDRVTRCNTVRIQPHSSCTRLLIPVHSLLSYSSRASSDSFQPAAASTRWRTGDLLFSAAGKTQLQLQLHQPSGPLLLPSTSTSFNSFSTNSSLYSSELLNTSYTICTTLQTLQTAPSNGLRIQTTPSSTSSNRGTSATKWQSSVQLVF